MKTTELTERQRQILQYIVQMVEERGYPPTLREILNHLGLRAIRAVQNHLEALQRKGYIRRSSTARGIELMREKIGAPLGRGIPIAGRISAGLPIPAVEEIEGVLDLDRLFPRENGHFALRVQGDSMIDAGIFDGDLVIVRQQPTAEPGEIVAALIAGEEATVKFFARKGQDPYLVPANPAYPPLRLSEGQIVGKVVGVIRQVKRAHLPKATELVTPA